MGETRVCAQVFVYAAFVIIAVVLVNHVKTSCPGPLKYYEDLGCTPVYKNNSRCATRYDCDHVYARSRLKCYINGHDYAINRALRQQDANHCEELCVCKRGYANDDIPAFDCIDIKSLCPKKRVKHGCYLSHDLSTCCGDPKEICPGPMKERHVCIVDTKVYMDGEYFPAKEDPRLTCVCKPGYEGKNVPPFCVRGNHSVCDNPAFSHKNYFPVSWT
ncbi:PREDICTED: uncharacterized protein LOC105563281 [Vollenhovia emeryi]|uniref:uncharacterized protein LOC105563281 n=1 Tax=Vollenhovia emeryi TaxID=411798 RepID=UPI0005F5770A|nr:PREDICTED: uncharacterized protein LOC105563281 [Vollenhovia emeryi]